MFQRMLLIAVMNMAAFNHGVTLNWQAPTHKVVPIKLYTIYRQRSDHNWAISMRSATTTFEDRTVIPNHTYTYWITATDTNGNEGPISNKVTVMVSQQ